MNVKIAICQWCLPGNGMYAAKLASMAGWDGVQIDLGTYNRGMEMTQKVIQESMLEDAAKYGIEYPSLFINDLAFGPFGCSMSKGKRGSEATALAYEMIKKAVQVAADMKIPAVMLPSFFTSEITNEEELVNTAETIRYCCELAGEKGIDVYHESILTPEDQFRLNDMVGLPNLYVLFDTQNYAAMTDLDQLYIAEQFQPVMGHQFHIKDGVKETSNRFVGEGEGKVMETIEFLKSKNYEGWIISENYYDRLPFRKLNEEDYLAISKKDLEIIRNAVQ